MRLFAQVGVLISLLISSHAFAQQDMGAEARLKALGIELPKVGATSGNYVAAVRVGNLLFMSGNGPRRPDGTLVTGKVGVELSTQDGYDAARLTGLYMLAAVRSQIGSLDKVKQVVRVFGMVNTTPDYKDHAKVLDGFSDLMVQVFGENGRGARTAAGPTSLAFQSAFIGEAILEVE
jgi:enamine deaminase RidA (YjgF/YER057c/UK114 family)